VEEMVEIISSLTVIFAASAAMLYLANKFSQPAIPAYITAGIFTGFLIDQSSLIGLVELGIAFLVFIFGLKFDPGKLKSVETQALTVNTLQLALLGALSFSFAYIIGLDLLHSFYFSTIATLSSSLVGMELMSKEIEMDLIHGRLSESIHLIQDLLAVGAIMILSSSSFSIDPITRKLALGASLIISALLIRKYIFDWIGKQAEGSTELLMLTALSFLTIYIGISQYLELSIVIGSFAAGIAVAKFPHNIEILETTGSIKDFFSAIFFVTLGALVSVPNLEIFILATSIGFFTTIVKPGLVIASLLHQGYNARTSFLTGVSLDQVSEFALIIAIQGYLSGLMIEPLFQATVLAATVTMVTSSYTKMYENQLFETLNRYNIIESNRDLLPETNIQKSLQDHIIIVGYDTQGKRIAEQLKEIDTDFLVIENDPAKISELREKEEPFIYGNVLDDKTWEKSQYQKAGLILSTVPSSIVSNKILKLETDADKILRAKKPIEAERLLHRGALYVIIPEILSAELLKEHILGVSNERNYIEELRRKNLLEIRRYLESEEG